MNEPPAAAVEFVLNGRRVRARPDWPQMTLLDFLRAEGLTGAKEGCAEGECGACAVLFVTANTPALPAAGPSPAPAAIDSPAAYRVVNSCLVFVPMAAGHEIYTVESLAVNGELADAQRVMAAAGGSQCGYCTPGFVMSLFAEQYRGDRAGPCDPLATAGNLCRCTGYRPIRDAALALGAPPPGPFAERLTRPAPPVEAAASAGFSRPSTVGECVRLLATRPGARVVAGGTDVGVESNVGGERWPHLVSVEAIDELRVWDDGRSAVIIGAALPLADIGRRWAQAPAVVHEWLALFASPAIRNRATLGGSLATASPIGDAAPLLAALDARLHLRGVDGTRLVDVAAFFTGYRTTVLRADEILTAIEIPKPLPAVVRFYKIAKRAVDDISTVAAAMAIDRDADGTVVRARFAFGGVAARPVRVAAAEEAVVGHAWSDATVARAQAILDSTLRPMSDHRGSAGYRRDVSQALLEKFWWETRG